jgi:macrolide transport system ATP-binding/permease protein
MQTLLQDLRYGARMLLKIPGFTLIAVMTLALGIGANITIFSFVNALILRPVVGISEPERLIQIGRTSLNNPFDTLAYPDYIDYRDQNRTLAGIAVYNGIAYHLSTGQEAERVKGALVSGNYFDVLGVRAARGRLLTPADAQSEGSQPVAVISAGLWRRRFAADLNVVGKTVNLNMHGHTIVGVAADDFAGTRIGEKVDVWVPVTLLGRAGMNPGLLSSRGSLWLAAFGRLKPGMTMEQAGADLAGIARRLEEANPQTNSGRGVAMAAGLGLWPEDREQVRRLNWILLGAVGIVMLIACANVAGLLLARAGARQKEIGIRLALGAGRLRVIRQLLTESLILASCGGLLGLLIASWLNDWLQAWLPESYLGTPLSVDLGLDTRVLCYAFAVALLTGVIFGLAPALQMSKLDLVSSLKGLSASEHRGGRVRLRSALVIAQVTLSLVLLVGAGLCIRTLSNAREINFGFDTEQVLTAKIDLGRQNYSQQQAQLFYQQLLDRARALPGVQQASVALNVPLDGSNYQTGIRLEGQPAGSTLINVLYNVTSPNYLVTMGIPLLLGRDFSPQDQEQAPRVAIINETMALRFWPNESPIGKRFTMGGRQLVEVIGLARDAKGHTPFDPSPVQLYLPLSQSYRAGMALHLRITGKPEQLIAAVQRTVRELDKNLPVYEVRTLSRQLDNALTPQRLTSMLIGGFGLLAMALAAIGLYGVVSYFVVQRTREIGIRLALGAQVRDVMRLVVKQGMVLALIGVSMGLIAAFAVTRFMTSLLFGVSPTDLLTYVVAAVLLVAVALLACWIPARRATRVDPMMALRAE